MDHRLISTILALLLSLSQADQLVELDMEDTDSLTSALPSIQTEDDPDDVDITAALEADQLVEPGSEDEIQLEDPDDFDFTAKILQSNNGSSETLMEGDLVVSNTRNALKCWNNRCLWRKSSNGLVYVPYVVSNQFPSYEKRKIKYAFRGFHSYTCIRFVRRSNQRDFLSIENRDGCYSHLGRTGGKQVVSLDRNGCVYNVIIQHELNHALGFYHEHTRSDRDYYVRINWENIPRNTWYNFQTQNTNNLNTPYDYASIMHYGRREILED